jgi:hypothetical protein
VKQVAVCGASDELFVNGYIDRIGDNGEKDLDVKHRG